MSAFCNLPFTKLRIKSNGDVSFCCIQKAILGNIIQNTLNEIWNGDIAKDVRKITNSGDMHNSCFRRFCPHEIKQRYPGNSVALPQPEYIDLDLPNTHCNVGGINPNQEHPACIMCPRSSTNFIPEDDRVDEICDKLTGYISHLKKLHIQGIAEPFWKGRIFQTIDRLKFEDHKNKVVLSTFTNGTLFFDKYQDQFIKKCPLSLLYFSLDAATPETYKKIRVLDAFNSVIDNIKSYNSKRNKVTQMMIITYNVNVINLEESFQVLKIAKDCGADAIEFNSTDPCDDQMKAFTVNSFNSKKFRIKQIEIEQECKKLKLNYKFIKPIFT